MRRQTIKQVLCDWAVDLILTLVLSLTKEDFVHSYIDQLDRRRVETRPQLCLSIDRGLDLL